VLYQRLFLLVLFARACWLLAAGMKNMMSIPGFTGGPFAGSYGCWPGYVFQSGYFRPQPFMTSVTYGSQVVELRGKFACRLSNVALPAVGWSHAG
jgi:hypothetical protein